MQFNSIPKEDLEKNIKLFSLKEGEATFKIIEAVDTFSKNGNPMISVKFMAKQSDGGSGFINDHFLVNTEYAMLKMCHLSESIGAYSRYKIGNISAEFLVNKEGSFILKIQKGKDGYKDKLSPCEYLVSTSGEMGSALADDKESLNDDIPF